MKRVLALFLAFVFIAAMSLAACNSGNTPAAAPPSDNGGSSASDNSGGTVSATELVVKGSQSDLQKDSIVIRGVRPLTGMNTYAEETAFGACYKMWVDLTNQSGGVYVKSLDRKVPIDCQVYDDGSDITKTTQLFEQVLANEKPDIILGPSSTAATFACSPIAQKYDYLFLSAEGGAKELEKYIVDNPNTFVTLSYSATQVPALIKIFDELGVKSVYCVYVDDLHGTEYWGATKPLLDAAGIETKGFQSVPLTGGFDGDAIVTAARNSGAQAFLCYTYPDQGIPITLSAVALDYNPDVFLLGPGVSYDFFASAVFGDLGSAGLEGCMGWGAWNTKSSAAAAQFNTDFQNYWIQKGLWWKNADGSDNPNAKVYQDWWGMACYISVTEVLQQCIENAGQIDANGILDQDTLVKYCGSADFNTVLNPKLHYTNNVLSDDMYLGNVGQWQKGIYEVVDNDARRTADPIYPKPAWPKN